MPDIHIKEERCDFAHLLRDSFLGQLAPQQKVRGERIEQSKVAHAVQARKQNRKEPGTKIHLSGSCPRDLTLQTSPIF